MTFVPRAQLRQLQGQDVLTDYQFGKRTIHHRFCSVCGIRCFGEGTGEEGTATAMVNVRCLDGVDVHELDVTQRFDGKNL